MMKITGRKTRRFTKMIVVVGLVIVILASYAGIRRIIASVNNSNLIRVQSSELHCTSDIENDIENEEKNKKKEVAGKQIFGGDACGKLGTVAEKTMKLEMNAIYTNKENCRQIARNILQNGLIEGMTEEQLAAEIYAHAFFYFVFDNIPDFVHTLPGFSKVYNSVNNGIDLEDGGDTNTRQVVYAVVYHVF